MKAKALFLFLLGMMASLEVYAQRSPVSGCVRDSQGEPLIGVFVQEVGNETNGTMTDLDGNYSLSVAPGGSLKFSCMGFKDAVVPVSGAVVDCTMQDDDLKLEEAVVVGYGTQRKESLTGAVTAIGEKTFKEKGGMSSPLQALQGQVPGVMITRSSSAPGDESWSMSLRGASSVNSTEPLIIIDGVACNSVSDMRLLNPNDIESINFLKDGSAAIYGSRAAGGVVLVTTKKGKAGAVRVDVGSSVTLKTVGLMPSLMSIDQWADGIMTTLENDNNTSSVWYTYAQLAKKYKGQYIDLSATASPFGSSAFTDVADFVFDDDVDWLGSLFGSCWSTDQSVGISGGSDVSSYRISLNYLYDGSPLQYGKNNNKRYNLRLNNTFKFGERLSLDSSIAFSRQDQVTPTLISSALTTAMPMPGLPLESMDGKPYAWGTWGSPVAKLENGGSNNLGVQSINISETLHAKITDWLDGTVNLGYNTSNATRKTVQNSISYYNYTGTTQTLTDPTEAKSYYQETSSRTDFYSASAYLTAKKVFRDVHYTTLMLGTQYELKDMEYFGAKASEILDGLEVINGSGTVSLVDGTSYNYRYANASVFSRFNYDYNGKYLLELNARYDGSSKFQKKNRWDFFWGISAGWRINQENFLKDVSWLSNLKLRASYAEMGSQSGIANYDGYQFYNFYSNGGVYLGSDLASVIKTSGQFASTTRQWERIKNYNVALDFGLFKGSITGSVEAFLKKNDNMLVAMTYPAVVGDKAPSANEGKFKDWGYEGQITYNGNIGNVNYHVGGTFTFARNELTDYGGTSVLKSGYTSTQQGYPLNSIFGLRYGGKIQNEEMLNAYLKKYYNNNGIGMPSNLRVGDNMYCDENGDGVLDYNDYIYLGSDTPEISYSFNFGASWKGLSANVVFQGAANRFVYRGIDSWTVPFRTLYTNTTTSSIGSTWSTSNPDAYYCPYTTDANIVAYDYQASSITSQDGRYIRLKEVTLSYGLPSRIIEKIGFIQNARFYFTGSDLWEWTRIVDGWDPEAKRSVSGTSRYPFLRTFTFGLNLTF